LYWNQLQTIVAEKGITDQCVKNHSPLTNDELELFFDSYECTPLSVEQLYFFDAMLIDEQTDNFDILSIHDILSASWNG
jgi:hypothetical protein